MVHIRRYLDIKYEENPEPLRFPISDIIDDEGGGPMVHMLG